jgi:hypothetical protein
MAEGCGPSVQPPNTAISSPESRFSPKADHQPPKHPSAFFVMEYQWDDGNGLLMSSRQKVLVY